ncbi:hypothetical protein DACRYDRAFT_106772 [Dacryopinax primogenitus]|uniref:Uncharacterized protein n=1 Tax=Dacryopinax primogenitus (strain DJM 731) TaxID=1858805 RepID=M5G1Z2_DACPD|nr:uncharacterized protein DACRYDRAFT_106772 [Dacryopinax primogenitus]EJU02709.1 hypothetical protein DACRYDRAFT_106772 [Dacryopinax primogenitus]
MNETPSGSAVASLRRQFSQMKLRISSSSEAVRVWLEDMTIRATGVASVLASQDKRCRELAEKTAFANEQVLQRMSRPDSADTAATELFNQLSQSLNDLNRLVHKYDDAETRYRGLTEEHIRALDEHLNSIIIKFWLKTVVQTNVRLDDHDSRLGLLEGRGNGFTAFEV